MLFNARWINVNNFAQDRFNKSNASKTDASNLFRDNRVKEPLLLKLILLEELVQDRRLKLIYKQHKEVPSKAKTLCQNLEKIIKQCGLEMLIHRMFKEHKIDLFHHKDKESKILRKEQYPDKIKTLLIK